MSNFVERLQRAARFAGVGDSQSDIARALNLARQTVNRWFMGGEPNAEQIFSIARQWRVSPEWLKSGVGEMLPDPGDGLTQEERELVKNYRSASAPVRQVIATMARSVRKSMVAIAMAIPPMLAPSPSEARPLFNITFSYYTLRCMSRRLWATFRFPYMIRIAG